MLVRRHVALLGTYLLPEWPRLLLLATLLLSGIGVDLVFPQLLRQFVDGAGRGLTVPALSGLAGTYLVMAVLAQAVSAAEAYVATDLSQRATGAMRARLTRHCLQLDLDFHTRHTPGELIERIDGDVGVLANYFSRFAVELLGNALFLAGVLALMFGVDWRLGVIFGAFSLCTLAVMRAVHVLPVPYQRRALEASASFYSFLEERLGGVEDIRASGAVRYTVERFQDRLASYTGAALKGEVAGSALNGLSGPAMAVATALAFATGAWLFLRGEITLGTVFLTLAYLHQLEQPIRHINRQLQDLAGATASLLRIEELLALRRTIRDGAGSHLPPGPLAVEFAGVCFTYPTAATPAPDDVRSRATLRDVSFSLARGEVLGVLGRAGSGKTTIGRLICRLCEPAAGTIHLGGIDSRQTRLADLRRRITLVTQEVQLFRASIRDNLTFFDRRVTDDQIMAALCRLGLEPWLAALPTGLDTPLGAGGEGLSAGEAQLLAFARVPLQDPGLLVLDEATSRLDPATARHFERAIDRLLAGRTAIVIAHRLATVNRANRILILESGQVVEAGDRATLVADPNSQLSRLLRAGTEVEA
jgi:ATP-binding cassette subfamily B protein